MEYWKTLMERINHHSSTPTLQNSILCSMPEYKERFYRNRVKPEDLVSFEVRVKETDLLVSAEQNLEKETRDLVLDSRHQIESYIQTHADSSPPSGPTLKIRMHRPWSKK